MTLADGERLIVDASVAVKWVAPEADSDRAAVVLDHPLIVPDLFFSECANIIWKKHRNGDLTEEETGIAAQTLEDADLSVIQTRPYVSRALAIAITLRHPAYDAMYLAVAEALGLRIVTADDRLTRTVRRPPGAFGHLVVPLAAISGTGPT